VKQRVRAAALPTAAAHLGYRRDERHPLGQPVRVWRERDHIEEHVGGDERP
jgi:hypothetical protein